jgi:hypothetical protein
VVSFVVTFKRWEHVQGYAKHENVSDRTFYAVDVKNVWAVDIKCTWRGHRYSM